MSEILNSLLNIAHFYFSISNNSIFNYVLLLDLLSASHKSPKPFWIANLRDTIFMFWMSSVLLSIMLVVIIFWLLCPLAFYVPLLFNNLLSILNWCLYSICGDRLSYEIVAYCTKILIEYTYLRGSSEFNPWVKQWKLYTLV